MKGSDFLRAYAKASRPEWEALVVELARRGELLPISWVEVPVRASSGSGGKTGSVFVSEDVITVGVPGDSFRMPLTASAAQAVADVYGALLPTKKLSMDINQAVRARVQPRPMGNLGANLESYARHSRTIDEQLLALGSPSGLRGGHKKDLVVTNSKGPGKEAIYGWYATQPVPGVPLYKDAYGAMFVQPLSDVHDDAYVDYSHGIRLVQGNMKVDGQTMKTEDVYRDPSLASLVSDEGPIKAPRYPALKTVLTPSLRDRYTGLTDVYVEGFLASVLLARTRRPA